MKIGIIGAGGIGQAFATQVTKAGYDVILSNSRGPESLAAAVSQLGPRARAGTRQEAAQAEVVVLAVNWEQVTPALTDLPAWNGRILIDATNPVVQPGFRLADLNGSTSSEVVASLARGARLVKVGNTLLRAVLAECQSSRHSRPYRGAWGHSCRTPGTKASRSFCWHLDLRHRRKKT